MKQPKLKMLANLTDKYMLRVGIMLGRKRPFFQWEKKIIEFIAKQDGMQFSVLILGDDQYQKRIDSIETAPSLHSRIYNKIIKFEKEFLPNQAQKLDPWKKVTFDDSEIQKIYLSPHCSRYRDKFSHIDCKKISSFKLDLIIRFGFRIVDGPIFQCAKNGIWSMHHGDAETLRGDPPGFWEVFERRPLSYITILELNEKLDAGRIVAKSAFSTNRIASWNRDHLISKSVNLMKKSLVLLSQSKLECPKDQGTYFHDFKKCPKVSILVIYLLYFLIPLLARSWSRIDCEEYAWELNYARGCFEKHALVDTNVQKSLKHEYWADPFIVEREGENFIFFERYQFSKRKGRLSVGRLGKEGIELIGDILPRDAHISFPQIINHDGKLLLIPETSACKAIEVWVCEEFPLKWKLLSTAFEGCRMVDPVVALIDENWWLFVNQADEFTEEFESYLYLYKVDSPSLQNPIPHRLNPILIDSRHARNGGRIFYKNDKIFRISQLNSSGIYGRGLNISEIKNITLEEYEEKIIKTILPNFSDKHYGLHHLDHLENFFVFDSCKKLSIFQQIMYSWILPTGTFFSVHFLSRFSRKNQ